MRIGQTAISKSGMGVTNIFPCIHSSSEKHGNEHRLPGSEVHHVNSLKEMAQVIILRDLVVEDFGSRLDNVLPPIRSYKSSIMVSSPISKMAISPYRGILSPRTESRPEICRRASPTGDGARIEAAFLNQGYGTQESDVRDHVTVLRSTSHSSAHSSANKAFGGVMVW